MVTWHGLHIQQTVLQIFEMNLIKNKLAYYPVYLPFLHYYKTNIFCSPSWKANNEKSDDTILSNHLLNGMDMGGPGNHTHQIWKILLFFMVLSERYSLQNQRTATRNSSSINQHQLTNSSCSFAKFPLLAADCLWYWWYTDWQWLFNCQTPNTPEILKQEVPCCLLSS